MDLKERFLKYVSYDTQSSEESTTFPSTEKQKVLLAALRDEMEALGMIEVTMDQYGYVMGTVPASKGCENASVSYIIRDHDAEKFEQKKVFMWAAVDLLKKKYGDQVVTLTLKDQYYNMRKMVEPHPQVIDKALKAMEMAGVKPLVRPIRGGTDGARLSFMGLPCPNLFTGGMNFHGKFEYCSLTTMRKAQQVILNLAVLWSE